MTIQIIIMSLTLIGMLGALMAGKMRPGMILFTATVVLLLTGLLTPREMVEGFSNKGMITVALLFLVSEGVRQSGALGRVIKRMLPERPARVSGAQARMLPLVSIMSAFINNTPVVVILAPIVKHWAAKVKMPVTKFLIPLSYATILGGMCTLIGTSTNLVVDGMMQDAGYHGFTMFELGRVGVFIAVAGIIYILLFSARWLPDERKDLADDVADGESSAFHVVEVVIGARFPGINKSVGEFDFFRHYGATVREIRRRGTVVDSNIARMRFHEGDTLVLLADDRFVSTWGDSSVFMLVSNGKDSEPPMSRRKRSLALVLLILMIVGATIGELPFVAGLDLGVELDMFFFASITVVIMAWTKMFPARKYTKYISWDILVTIACAFAVSKAMVNSGLVSSVTRFLATVGDSYGPYVLLAMLFILTNILTELITNNAAAALVFPLAISLAEQMGVSPVPFFVVICIAASASFSTPIGYQTNLIVQGIGNYRFTDFVRFGLPLNIITFLISVTLIPWIWPFHS